MNKYIDYYKNNPEGYWFKRRLFGWGWVPVTWQGWLLTVVYVALVILFALTIDDSSPVREVVFTFLLPVVILTTVFIGITMKKGEKPKWMWGLRDEDAKKDKH